MQTDAASRCLAFLLLVLASPGVFSQESKTSRYLEQAARMAASMDDSTLAAQVLITAIHGSDTLAPGMRALLERIPVGGVMLFRFNLNTSQEGVKRLLSETASLIAARAGVPPFMSVDHEGGLVHRFGAGVERLPSAYSFWELALVEGRFSALTRAETLYRRSAREIRELGINMVLAPVAEPLNEENSVFLTTRSFGPDPCFTEAAASAFVAGMDAAGIASVVKHFPGNTAIDPHYDISSLMADKDTLDEMVRPFAGIIRRLDPASVMISHVKVPAIDSERNASLSRAVIEDWLRGELGFEGIVMSDDYSMGAVTALGINHSAATIEALNAGVDMIMVWPQQLPAVHNAILQALWDGRLSRARLEEAATRIIAVKLRYGII
jgi:beta-N-acetylhexosaminidase